MYILRSIYYLLIAEMVGDIVKRVDIDHFYLPKILTIQWAIYFSNTFPISIALFFGILFCPFL